MTGEIESKILERHYVSPGRARAALERSSLGNSEKKRLRVLIDSWDNEDDGEPVVGAVAPANRPDGDSEGHLDGQTFRATKFSGAVVNLNVRVRAELTLYGMSLVYAAQVRGAVTVKADDLVAQRGVWETELWTFMSVMAPGLSLGGDPVTVNNEIALLPREGLLKAVPAPKGASPSGKSKRKNGAAPAAESPVTAEAPSEGAGA